MARRLERTRFASCREEALRKRRETAIRRALNVLASTRNIEARQGRATTDLATLIEAARKRRFSLPVSARGEAFADDLGFVYQATTRGGRFRVLAAGTLWKGDGEVVFLYDERIGVTGVVPVSRQPAKGGGNGRE